MEKGKIIVAVDVSSSVEACKLMDALGEAPWAYKIGLQLFVREGPAIVAEAKRRGTRVFLDLKFHDIPNTVREAVRSAVSLGADLLTVHLSGGPEMLRAAVEGAKGSSCLVLGVSVLTSSDVSTLQAIGISVSVEQQVLRLGHLAVQSGLGGIVASPLEIEPLREEFGDRLKIVTPGVRPAGVAQDDQKRVMTPGEAIAAGAYALVVGRPVTAASDPAAALRDLERATACA